jgi:trk system potassium uptake protein TrkH
VALSFLVTIAIAGAVGSLLYFSFKTENKLIYAKEGFVMVAFGWIVMSVIGAIPFVLSGDIPSYIDAFFETVSGFTTTGASILTDVESLSYGGLFWRSFTHWIGGMGVLVFIMAILPSITDRSIHIMRAEMPGPIVGKIVPRARETARILYIIYFVMTLIEAVLLLAGDMPLYDSVVHAFGTAGTGGFGIKADSIASYSPYLQWVITVFMFLFGINFNLYYLLLHKKFKSALSSGELWTYVGISIVAVALIGFNINPMCSSVSDSIRASAFQVSSIITSTGFSTVNYNTWPTLSKAILILLMFIGACAGSTGGGFKVARIIMLFKMIKQELRRVIHPRSIVSVKFEGKVLDKTVLSSVSSYLAIFLVFFIATILLISFEPFGFETNFTTALSCFNNIGAFFSTDPGIGFASYSPFSKIVLSFAMLFGRLEIYPLLIALTPSTWTKN